MRLGKKRNWISTQPQTDIKIICRSYECLIIENLPYNIGIIFGRDFTQSSVGLKMLCILHEKTSQLNNGRIRSYFHKVKHFETHKISRNSFIVHCSSSAFQKQRARKCENSNLGKYTFFLFPVTFISLRSDFPTLKSTAVIPPSSLKATWEGANPTTHKL